LVTETEKVEGTILKRELSPDYKNLIVVFALSKPVEGLSSVGITIPLKSYRPDELTRLVTQKVERKLKEHLRKRAKSQ